MLNFAALGSVYRVTYKMWNKTKPDVVDFDTLYDATCFELTLAPYVRRGMVIDFRIECVAAHPDRPVTREATEDDVAPAIRYRHMHHPQEPEEVVTTVIREGAVV